MKMAHSRQPLLTGLALLNLLVLGGLIAIPSYAQTPGLYTAGWHPSTESEIQQGWRLKLLSTHVVGGQVRYTAVWRPSTEGEIEAYGSTYPYFKEQYDRLWPQGWRLKLLSTYVLCGQVSYAAVWHPSTEGEIQVYERSYPTFRAKYDELWPQGWRLKLLSTYVVGGQVRYTAVWRPSTEGEIQVYGWSYPNFRAKYDELWPQGWRLTLLSTYVIGGQVRYTAVWRRSTEGEIQAYDWSYENFSAKYDELRHQLVSAVDAHPSSVSVLTINLLGIEKYGGDCNTAPPGWQDRYKRIADWIGRNQSAPDLIALQEAVGWRSCPFGQDRMPDYASLHFLISAIKEKTGTPYRIAYLIGGRTTPTGACAIWMGDALLYNPERLRNAIADQSQDLGFPHDDQTTTGVHLRRSLPCCNPAQDRVEVCGWIDDPKQTDKCSRETGAGLAWVGPIKVIHWWQNATFALLERRDTPGQYVHIYNVHLPTDAIQGTASFGAAKTLIGAMEARFPTGRYFPPILVGDFNVDEASARTTFTDFDIAGYSATDVIGVLIGKPEKFPSQHRAEWGSSVIVTGHPACGGTTWSDHCAIFVRFAPP